MLEINRAIERGIDSLDIEILSGKAAFCSTDPLRPVNTDGLSTTMQQSKTIAEYSAQIKAKPITNQLHNLPPVSVKLISESDLEPLWNQLVRSYHYLGYQKLIGHRLKYLALIEDQPVAALSWSAPALKLAARDQYIGWSAAQRKRHLKQLASNSRFLRIFRFLRTFIIEKKWTIRFPSLVFIQTSMQKGGHHVHQSLVPCFWYSWLRICS
jgi:hypothetical protein